MLEHLPERDRPAIKARLRRAWATDDHELALDGLQALAVELDRSHPGAAASLREGLEETLTLTRLRIRGRLKRTLISTNPIESMIEIVRRTSRNVKRWQSGDMCLRWTAAGMLEAEQQFRKVIGYSDLAKLAIAVERDLTAQRTPAHTTTPRRPPRSPPPDNITPGPPSRSSTTDGTRDQVCAARGLVFRYPAEMVATRAGLARRGRHPGRRVSRTPASRLPQPSHVAQITWSLQRSARLACRERGSRVV